MSLSGLFDIGKSALFASQTALNVVSNNIANVNTPGYDRQEVVLQVASAVQLRGDFIGRGVDIADVRRHYDKFIHLQLIGQNESYGRSYSLEQALSHVEQVFNEAKDLGLSNSLKNYFNAWQGVSINPENVAQRSALLQQGKALVQNAKQIDRDVLDALGNINDEIDNVVDQVNTITSQISKLNEKIAQVEAGKSAQGSSYMRDQRDQLLNDLAGLINYSWYEDESKYVTILVGGKSLVTSLQANELSTSENLEGSKQITLGGADITPVFERGKLGGYLDVHDDIKNDILTNFRKLIASVIKETNDLHSSGFGLDGSTNNNFFDSLQIYTRDYSTGAYIASSAVADSSALTLDEYDINFTDASNYEIYNHGTGELVTTGVYTAGSTISFEGIEVVIDGVPSTGDSFFVSPLTNVVEDFNVSIADTQKIAAAASGLSLPGDNAMAIQMYQLSQGNIAELGESTFISYYRGIVSDIGIMNQAATDSLKYDDNLLFELQKKREEVSGVSLDEEAANLIKYQRSYEAGARILKITDELLQTIIQL